MATSAGAKPVGRRQVRTVRPVQQPLWQIRRFERMPNLLLPGAPADPEQDM